MEDVYNVPLTYGVRHASQFSPALLVTITGQTSLLSKPGKSPPLVDLEVDQEIFNSLAHAPEEYLQHHNWLSPQGHEALHQ